jgi:hypothetical protein
MFLSGEIKRSLQKAVFSTGTQKVKMPSRMIVLVFMLHFIAADPGIWCFFDSGIRDKFFPDPRFNPYFLKISNNFSMVSVTSLSVLRH